MEKKQAQRLIEDTFNNSFSEEQFTVFAKNLLNDFEDKHNHYSGNLIWDDYKEHINSYKRIGKYIDPDGEALDVLMVEVKTVTKLERARTVLRNFVIKHLSKFEKDYALVAFYSKEDKGADWRFSFIKLEYRSELDQEKGKVKTKKEFTPAKRYSFLVGKYEKAHTAKNQLLPLLQNISNNPTIEELETAFSIEKVTDEFFNQYKDLYVKLFEHFENDNRVKAELEKTGIDNARFTKKLLGQIVFLYFLQKKGWLGVAKNERWGTGHKRFVQNLFEQAQHENANFFKDKLQYLFYEALAKQRDNENSYYQYFDCRIPFLNGGLFEADYNWQEANISIPSTLFRNEEKNKSGDIGTGVLDVFDRYNFTIKEDEPLDKEVAVDPEMLGKVFENMLDITERKSKGAFYTPREIVHYMCQESLIHYLDNALEEKVPKKNIETYIREGHFALENDERVATKGETKTYQYQLPESIRQNADLIDKQLSSIKICDPAIGSGAFPVGLLHELVNAMLVLKPHFSYDYLTQKLVHFGFEHRESVSDSRYIYRLKRHIIQESIYGVDIDASAIDIARLRLWLSLVVDEDDLDPIETLPNLDYKIVCGNSLIGLPEDAMRDYEVEMALEAMKEKFYNITDDVEKKQLRKAINTKIRELLDSAEQFAGYKIDFDFKLFFSEVWREKNGFDVVIGNPPWLALIGKQMQKYKKADESKNLKIYKEQYIFNSYMPNLYEFFLQKSHRILANRGTLTLIIPDRFGFNDSSYELRKFFINNSVLSEIVYKWNFPQIITETMTFICQKRQPPSNYSFYIKNKKDSVSIKEELSIIKKDSELIFRSYESSEIRSLIQLVSEISEPLSCYAKSTSGFGAVAGTISDERVNDLQMEVLKGSSIKPFIILKPYFFEFINSNLGGRTRDIEKLSKIPKTCLRKTGYPIICSFDTSGRYPEQSLYFFYEVKEEISDKFLLLYFNSDLANFYFWHYLGTNLESTPQLKNKDLDRFPINIKGISLIPFNIIADYLLEASQNNYNSLITSFYKELSNSIVFESIFSNQFRNAGKEILKHLGDLKPINSEMSEEEKLAIIQSEFERLYDPNHPVRFAIETLDSVEEVRIIREALK